MSENALIVWDLAGGREVRRFTARGRVGLVRFLPDGRRAAVAVGNDVEVWDTADGRVTGVLHGPDEPIRRLDLSPDGRRLAYESDAGTAGVWDVESGAEVYRLRLSEERESYRSVAFSPDGRALACGMARWPVTQVRVLDAKTGKPFATGEPIAAGDAAARSEADGDAGVMDVLKGLDEGPPRNLAYAPDSRRLIGHDLDSWCVWDVWRGEVVVRGGRKAGVASIRHVAFLPDGRRAVAACFKGLYLIDAETGKVLSKAVGRLACAEAFALSPDGRYALTGTKGEYPVRLWRMPD